MRNLAATDRGRRSAQAKQRDNLSSAIRRINPQKAHHSVASLSPGSPAVRLGLRCAAHASMLLAIKRCKPKYLGLRMLPDLMGAHGMTTIDVVPDPARRAGHTPLESVAQVTRNNATLTPANAHALVSPVLAVYWPQLGRAEAAAEVLLDGRRWRYALRAK